MTHMLLYDKFEYLLLISYEFRRELQIFKTRQAPMRLDLFNLGLRRGLILLMGGLGRTQVESN